MMTDIQLRTLAVLVVVIWVVVLVVQGRPISLESLRPFSYVVSVVSVALLLWERWLWKWHIFRPWLTIRPDLRGTWKGQLTSDWKDPYTNQPRGAVEVYLVIWQTFSTISVRLFSVESSSVSLSGSILEEVGVQVLAITYRNTPTILRREVSPINHGGMLLSIRGHPIHQLDGEYWTDRHTKGEVTFAAHTKEISDDFVQATHKKFQAA